MEQDIFCPSCGRPLFVIDDKKSVMYLRQVVEQSKRCECGASPTVYGVRFE